jgi:hypothetical protein
MGKAALGSQRENQKGQRRQKKKKKRQQQQQQQQQIDINHTQEDIGHGHKPVNNPDCPW